MKRYHYYNDEQKAWLAAHITGRTYQELTDAFNARFGLSIKRTQLIAIYRYWKRRNPATQKFHRHSYSDEQRAWLAAHIKGRTYQELTDAFNARFGLSLKSSQIRGSCSHWGLFKGGRVFSDEQITWLASHIKGRTYRELAAAFNARFGLARTATQVKDVCNYRGLRHARK